MMDKIIKAIFSFKFRITLILFSLILFTLTLVGVFSYKQIIFRNLEPLLGSKLEAAAQGIAFSIAGEDHRRISALLKNDFRAFQLDQRVQELRRVLIASQKKMGPQAEIKTFVQDPDQPDQMVLLLTSSEEPKTKQVFPIDPYVQLAMNKGARLFTSVFKNSQGESWISAFAGIEMKNGDVAGVVRLDYWVDGELKQIQKDIERTVVLAGSLSLVFASFLALLFSRSISRPIQILEGITYEVASGNWNPKFEFRSRTELGILASHFKVMISELRQNRTKMESQLKGFEQKLKEQAVNLGEVNYQISTILNSIEQGFFSFDKDGDCLPTYSKACLSLLEGSPDGKTVLEYLKGYLPEALNKDLVFDNLKKIKQVFEEQLPFEELYSVCPTEFTHSEGKAIQIKYLPVRNDSGKISQVVGIATDLSAQVEAQEALYEPIEGFFEQYDSLVQQLAKAQGKLVNPIEFIGGGIRLYARPLQNLLESFVYAFRNVVEQSLETPDERKAAGKEEAGKISVRYSLLDKGKGNIWLSIQITDDGKGLTNSLGASGEAVAGLHLDKIQLEAKKLGGAAKIVSSSVSPNESGFSLTVIIPHVSALI